MYKDDVLLKYGSIEIVYSRIVIDFMQKLYKIELHNA
jgi:hypothetical protein